jgi:diguanylate cyclase (GGDEF)-like protein
MRKGTGAAGRLPGYSITEVHRGRILSVTEKEREIPLTDELEKEIFDLRQLLQVSKSLSSNLDYSSLLDSILYICMGQMRVTQAALFSRDNLEVPGIKLVRNLEGFELDPEEKYILEIDSPLIEFLTRNYRCYSMGELGKLVEDPQSLRILSSMRPSLIVPLNAKDQLMGILVLGERIHSTSYSEKEKEYLVDIAHFAANAIHNAVLFEMSTTDMMTHLKLRHYFNEVLNRRISQSIHSGQPVSLIMADIDHFKEVNDTYGHQTGDEVLKTVSLLIRNNLRQNDIGARYGGEEFMILLHDTDEEGAYEIAERLRTNIATLDHSSRACLHPVHISMGVAQFDPRIDKTAKDLVKRVDQALYFSKQNGRNRSSRSSQIPIHP